MRTWYDKNVETDIATNEKCSLISSYENFVVNGQLIVPNTLETRTAIRICKTKINDKERNP